MSSLFHGSFIYPSRHTTSERRCMDDVLPFRCCSFHTTSSITLSSMKHSSLSILFQMKIFIYFWQPFGCDNVFGSTLKLDDCGICGGNGSSCSKMAGTMETQLKKSKLWTIITLIGMAGFDMSPIKLCQLFTRLFYSKAVRAGDLRLSRGNGNFVMGRKCAFFPVFNFLQFFLTCQICIV